MADPDALADEGRRHAVAVALEANERAAADEALGLELGRVGERRQRQERLRGRPLGDRLLAAAPGIGDLDAPAVEACLRLGGSGDLRRPPPGAAQVADRRLDHALALGPPRRADGDGDAVVLGDLGKLRTQAIAAGLDDRRHPVGAPAPRRPPEPPQDAVEAGDKLGQAHPLGEHGADLPRVREGADEHVGGLAPGCLAKLEPVELDLLAGLVRKLDRDGMVAPLAELAGGPQLEPAELACQGRVGAPEAELSQLA